MIVNEANIDLAFRGFKTVYTDAHSKAPIYYDKIAMTVPSSSRDEAYGWLGQMPQLREWLDGDRVVKDLSAHGFTIENKKFESTVSVKRDDISDDRLGIFTPQFSEMGHRAAQHPDELIFNMLTRGFSETCFDGQPYFDADHPGVDADGAETTVSNMQAGSSAPWFLMDTSRAMKPIIWQEREKYDFQSLTNINDVKTFLSDLFLFGIRARVNCGFGLWQLSYGSKAELNPENYAAARAQMMTYRGDQGRILGVNPTTMVVSPEHEEAARRILNSENAGGGETNPWKGTAELIVTPYLAA